MINEKNDSKNYVQVVLIVRIEFKSQFQMVMIKMNEGY